MTSIEIRERRRHLRAEGKKFGKSLEEIPENQWPEQRSKDRRAIVERVLRSREFLVQIFGEIQGARRLTASRIELDKYGDWKDGITWDDLQRLKRESGYGHFTAVEIFPADADVVNVANVRHLWILPSPLPFQWTHQSQ